MKINIENGKAHVYTPYNKDFVKAIKGRHQDKCSYANPIQ